MTGVSLFRSAAKLEFNDNSWAAQAFRRAAFNEQAAKMDRNTSPWLIPLLMAAGVCVAVWYYWSNMTQQATSPPPIEQPAPRVNPEPAPASGPQYPMPATDFPDATESELRSLPQLNDSDQYFKLELTDLFGDPVGALIAESRVIERVVATVDNLPRSHVAERIRPVTGLTDTFVAESEGGSLYAISEESYRRFDALVAIIEDTEIGELADLYQRYFPLFQKAYVELGYPNGYFNDRLVEAIDDMLASPEPSGTVYLVRPHVLYEFEDTDLESRSSGQKLMLRMGNENAAKIKLKLQELRDAIAE